jgi:hypothetical protein
VNPDFIITVKGAHADLVYIVLPTHVGALNWMFAHVEPGERRSMSAHLDLERFMQFEVDVRDAAMTFSQPSSPQPAGGESTNGRST